MPSVDFIRHQLETSLAHRIPAAFTPTPPRPPIFVSTGIQDVDELLDGGLVQGVITEIMGSECSGRTSFALSYIARTTQAGKVCAWIDVSDGLDPESAAAAGVVLSQLLWVRCGVSISAHTHPPARTTVSIPKEYFVAPPVKKGLHGGGFGAHPRNEVKGLSQAVSGLLRPDSPASRVRQPVLGLEKPPEVASCTRQLRKVTSPGKPWSRIEQGLRATDLLLQEGGFSAIVLDMSSIEPADALRVPLTTWFRYRAAAERNQSSILLLTQHSCAKSSADTLLQISHSAAHHEGAAFTGMEHRVEVVRRRSTLHSHTVVPLHKRSQRATATNWQSRTAWAGQR